MRRAIGSLILMLASPATLAQAHNGLIPAGAWVIPVPTVIQAPEPWSVALLAIDLASVGALVFWVRRRGSRTK